MKEELSETLDALPIIRRESGTPQMPKKNISPANTPEEDAELDEEQLENVSGGVRFQRTPDGGRKRNGGWD